MEWVYQSSSHELHFYVYPLIHSSWFSALNSLGFISERIENSLSDEYETTPTGD